MAVSLLNQHKCNFTIVEYLKKPLSKDKILSLSKKLGKNPGEFVRKMEADFKNNKMEKYVHDDDQIAEAMTKFPKIIERPILEKGNNAVIGRPPENILKLISK